MTLSVASEAITGPSSNGVKRLLSTEYFIVVALPSYVSPCSVGLDDVHSASSSEGGQGF